MKVIFSAANQVTYGLTPMINRYSAHRFSSAVNLTFSSSNYEDDKHYRHENLPSLNKSFVHSAAPNSLELGLPHTLAPVGSHRQTSYDMPVSRYQVSNHELLTIKRILTKYAWNFGLSNGFGVELNEANVIKALNIIFDESASAALALCFFRWLQHEVGFECTIRSVCTLICILVYRNMSYRAVDLLDSLIKHHSEEDEQRNLLLIALQEVSAGGKVKETVYSMIVKCYIDRKMTKSAVSVVCHMERLGFFPSRGVCNPLIRSLLGSNQEQLAWDLLEQMWSQGMVDASLVSPFISHYCSKGSLHSAWKLLMDMRYYGIKPDVVSYTIVIHSLCKVSCLEQATSLLFKMTQIGLSPDTVLLNTMVDICCKMDQQEEAICIADYFKVSPNIYVYNRFISLCCKVGDMAQASNIFQEMSELGFLPNCFSYSIMISGYCKSRDTKKALEWLGRMLKSGIKPSLTTFTILIQNYCHNGAMKMAEHLYCKMTEGGLVADVVVFNTLMDGYGKKGELREAFQILGMMKYAGVSPDMVTYNIIIHSLIRTGFLYEAKDIFNELICRGFSPDVITFTNLIGGFADRGQFQEAFLMWSAMSKYNTRPDVITCSALLSGYCRSCRMDEASALFNKMCDVGLIPDLMLWNTLIHGFCFIGETSQACSLIKMMVEQGLMPNDVTYQALVLGYGKRLISNPAEVALSKLQHILAAYGLSIAIDQYQV